jgi:fimbrial isopeptide formation D2 family protein
MYGGLITDNRGEVAGGTFDIKGEFYMYGGEISYNLAAQKGGGITVTGVNAYAEIRGGTIIGNQSPLGGGIYTEGKLVICEGVKIINNTATLENGQGGGIYTTVANYSNLTISPDIVFHGNRATNAYLPPEEQEPLGDYAGLFTCARTSIFAHPLNNYDINYISDYAPPVSDIYEITYDANGGDGGTVSLFNQDSTSITVREVGLIGFTNGKHPFLGWSTVQNPLTEPGGIFYPAGSVIESTGNDIILYAQWGPYDLTAKITKNIAEQPENGFAANDKIAYEIAVTLPDDLSGVTGMTISDTIRSKGLLHYVAASARITVGENEPFAREPVDLMASPLTWDIAAVDLVAGEMLTLTYSAEIAASK